MLLFMKNDVDIKKESVYTINISTGVPNAIFRKQTK